MELNAWIAERVHIYYWRDDINCATTMLKILTELARLTLHPDVIRAASGLHGAGGFGAQCVLVEGGLMFIGLAGTAQGWPAEEIARICRDFAAGFTANFGSLICRELRPEGFSPDNPPHLCEKRSADAVLFAARYMDDQGLIQQFS